MDTRKCARNLCDTNLPRASKKFKSDLFSSHILAPKLTQPGKVTASSSSIKSPKKEEAEGGEDFY